MGQDVDHLDQREVGELGLSKEEQNQLTKLSLGKIVNNLRQKLKDEEKRYQLLSLKAEGYIKEKEQYKMKLENLKREKKINDFVNNPTGATVKKAPVPVVHNEPG
jgi:hypothetical protein